MTETEFIQMIDCNFPYEDKLRCRELITLGHKISSNSSFMVLSEICRKPGNSKVTEQEQMELLIIWQTSSIHPLKNLITEAGKAVIFGEDIGNAEYEKMITEITPYKDEYCALGLLSCSCRDFEYADKLYENVKKEWNA